MKFKHRKDQGMDLVYLLGVITSVAITFMFVIFIYGKIGVNFHTMNTEMPELVSNASVAAYDAMGGGWSVIDGMMSWVIIGLTIILLISEFSLPTSPIFFFLNIFWFIVLRFIAFIYTNVYVGIQQQVPELANITTQYMPYTNTWMLHLPMYCMIVMVISTIVLYGKAKQEGLF